MAGAEEDECRGYIAGQEPLGSESKFVVFPLGLGEDLGAHEVLQLP